MAWDAGDVPSRSGARDVPAKIAFLLSQATFTIYQDVLRVMTAKHLFFVSGELAWRVTAFTKLRLKKERILIFSAKKCYNTRESMI